MASSPITCFACGGSYTADQRRRHEQTTKHQDAIRPGMEAHVAKLNGQQAIAEAVATESPTPIFDALKSGALAVVEGKIVPAFPVEAAEIDRLTKAVKSRAADVRWSEKPEHGDSAEKLAKRRERLATAQAELDAALMSIPETGN